MPLDRILHNKLTHCTPASKQKNNMHVAPVVGVCVMAGERA